MPNESGETSHIGRRTLLGVGLTAGAGLVTTRPAEAAGIDTKAALTSALSVYLRGRIGTLGLYVYDARNGQAYGYNNFRSETLSTMKVLVIIALMRQCEQRGTWPTASQQTLASRMIINSDNAATDSLIQQIGLTTIRRVALDLHMSTSTIQGGGYGPGWWGYSMSTPLELLRMVMAVTYGSYLTYKSRVYIQGLMAKVTASQRWGVCDPPLPWSVYALTKNGWGPRTGGYRVNSVGYVNGNGRLYSMAILSRSPNGFAYGKATVNAVSTMVYNALDQPLR